MNKLVTGCLLVVAFLIAGQTLAQNKYTVYFSDKDGVEFDPYTYFDAKAIERRLRHNLPLNAYTDRPVRSDYAATVSNMVDSLKLVSRWFNAAVVYASNEQIAAVEALPFVTEVEYMTPLQVQAASTKPLEPLAQDYVFELAKRQTDMLGREAFHAAGITGKGVRVAIFDVGFPEVDQHPAFQHVRQRNGILHTFDFVKNKEFVYGYGSHGTNVMSNICGYVDGIYFGLAKDAEFMLARTEMALREPFSEEENWLAAAEWADKHGADIINSSLGYTEKRYFPQEMDGKTAFVSRAANIAARKGLLVINAAGNEGDDKWKCIGAPADADSVLSIGGISPETGFHIGFSSYGPTHDKRMKPNVSAFGKASVAAGQSVKVTYGTSFACPLISGFAACAMQTRPDLKNMELYRELEQSGNLAPYFDYAHGFGVPRAAYFLEEELPEQEPTFELKETEFYYQVVIKEDYLDEIKADADSSIASIFTAIMTPHGEDREHLYFHIENAAGFLGSYNVINVRKREVYKIFKEDLQGNKALRIHYKGYTVSKKL